jgi:hypothetical protein
MSCCRVDDVAQFGQRPPVRFLPRRGSAIPCAHVSPHVPAFRALVLEHLLALGAIDEAGAEQLRHAFAPPDADVMEVMSAAGLPASIRLTAVATAAGMPIAPTYLLQGTAFDRISHADATRLGAVPISLVIGGLGLVYASAEAALAGDRALPPHVAYIATPEVVREHLARAAPHAMDAQDTLLLDAPDPALLAAARRSSPEPSAESAKERANALRESAPTQPLQRPPHLTTSSSGSFVEHTLEGPSMPVVASHEAAAALDRADRELSWIPLPPLSDTGDPFAGDTLIQTRDPSASAEDGAHQVLAKLTETGLPAEGVRFSGSGHADPFSLMSDAEVDSWDK